MRERKFAFSLPNMLTYGRVAAIGLIVAAYALVTDFANNDTARLTAAFVFLIASATDFFDGYYARKWDMGTALGKMLDPIADKMLVAVVLLILCADGTISGWQILAPALILCREFLVSGLREIAGGAKGVTSVTQLAKWKTTTQLIALLLLLAGPVWAVWLTTTGMVLLWVSAGLTLFTGYDYLWKTLAYLTREAD
ncbi:MAG: CDP-diacylglycerol--glycerol-3-phosphate 3-phosphatidyltransferase [Pseudomonadota bacterium]